MTWDGKPRPLDYVDRYLRRLSRWAPRACRHDLVAEASRHLYDATARAEAIGLPHDAAQRAAVATFGPAWRIGLAARGLDEHPLLLTLHHAAGVGRRVATLRRVVSRHPSHRPRRRPRPRLF